ncbi:hypothetical protein HMPREF1624_05335 [Sporothrix schenckii ATCC 58251]|uniref:Fibronectin type-III domain-containing protein n=1 Tax=Sporothrix schenckii (strain ATCC 58251 / de Perez 2211183) TaxID=1391915 RepID=U7PVR6_SPOS1|nr:hypothetical protein HMPREF1624_05335 [Sporothrix schenckii ATCC 58251]
MRWPLVLAGSLTLVYALPQAVTGSSTNYTVPNNSTVPSSANGTMPEFGGGSIAITDPVRVAYYDKLHAEVLEGMRNGSAVPLRHFINLTNTDGSHLDKRQGGVFAIIEGFFLFLEALDAGVDVTGILAQIGALFGFGDTEWWSTTTRCRVHFQTHGGADEKFWTVNKGSQTPVDVSNEKYAHIGWSDFDQPPHVFYYDTVNGVGTYSVQFTATDTHTWDRDLPITPNEAPKIMVVGDSISHGMQDDWTWRYRVWTWLKKYGYQATFVGPYTGTHGTPGIVSSEPMAPPLPGEEALNFQTDGGYNSGVASEFAGSGHASYWGRQATQVVPLINEWVTQFQPDYLLILLGFNDLGWFAQGPDGLIGQMGALIENAREAKADLKLLVGNVVQRLFIDGRQDLVDSTNAYNSKLKASIPDWFRWESPIAYVDVAAQHFATNLADNFGFVAEPYQIPVSLDGRPVRTPTTVRAISYPEGIFTTWDNMPNNRGYRIRSRVYGASDWWSDGLVYPSTWGSWLSWVLPGQTWEMQVATRGDGDTISDWSGSVLAIANPATAPAPSSIVDLPVGSDSLQVYWTAVSGYNIHCYGVLVWDRDTPGAFLGAYATQDVQMLISGLKTGHRYGIWVATYINLNPGSLTSFAVTPGGLPGPANDVIVGGGVPAPPSSVTYTPIDGTTLTLSWPAVANAAGYTIYMKSVSGGSFQVIGSTTATSQGIAFLFPGIWTYQFCVGSYNGFYQSSYGGASCVTPTICCGYTNTAAVVHGPAAAAFSNTTTSTVVSALPSPSLITPDPSATNKLAGAQPPISTFATTTVNGNSTFNATLLTTDPEIGQLYALYTEALSAVLQNGTTLNLTFAAPDTVVKLF